VFGINNRSECIGAVRINGDCDNYCLLLIVTVCFKKLCTGIRPVCAVPDTIELHGYKTPLVLLSVHPHTTAEKCLKRLDLVVHVVRPSDEHTMPCAAGSIFDSIALLGVNK
jgi:hypothetical protein